DFNKLTVNSINKKLICFLKEAFELSVVFSYLKANELSYEEYQQDFDSGKKLVEFLCNRFYPNKEHQKIERSTFLSMSKMDAIEHILFINVDLDFEWKLYEEYPVFMISKGKYLSFNSCLFLLSMFLYKGEAEKMISKIKGFKKNDDDEHRSKRNIFTFFSKKFSSQDVDSEEQHLVKFRDIIQYLNHYPTAWNDEIGLEMKHPAMTEQLRRYIDILEIHASFSNEGNKRFLLFAIREFFGEKYLDKWFEGESQEFSELEAKTFLYEINTSPELKDIHMKLKLLKNKTSLSF